MSVFRQIICTFVVCTLGLNFGLLYAWPSSTIKLFSSSNTTLNRPMTETELALFGSLSSISALFSTPLSGFLLDLVGRKYTCLLFALPQALAWTLVSAFNRVETILVAMVISGLGGCLFTIVPVFVSEFCQESIRGTMTACTVIFYGIGMLLSYVLGGCLDYNVMTYVCLTLAVIGVVLLTFLKESPTFLMKKRLEKDAAISIAFYRSTTVNSREVSQEMSMIRKTLHPEMDDSPEEEKLKNTSDTTEKLSFVQFFKKSKSTRRGLMISMIMWSFTAFQGLVAVQVYAEPLFEEAMPNISSYLASIMFAVMSVVFGIVAAYLTDMLGRRILMIGASTVAGVFCVLLGTQIHIHWGPYWVNAVFLYGYCIAYTFGAGTVPYVLVADLFLPEVRSKLSMASVEWAWICNFIVLFLFNPLVGSIGLGPVFYLFSVVCFISAIFTFFFLPETKGLTVDVIQTLLVKRGK